MGRSEQSSLWVYVCDPDAVRSRALVECLTSAAGPVIREGAPPINGGARSLCCVGLSNPFSEDDLNRIRTLKERSMVIASYAERTAGLSVGRQCDVFLAGAPILLDSSVPDFVQELGQAVIRAFEQCNQSLRRDNCILQLMDELAMVGRSTSLLEVFRQAQRVSQFSDLPVLITGETGTGKELLAKAIHRQDERRCRGPFVPLNCAALNHELSDSELFGHRKGSFTGAGQDRAGLFRAAHHGVLFLDEIGELDLGLQAKLLRVLQENRVLRVGDDQETSVDVRVLTATHRNLAEMVDAGTFREDLYHRLNVISLHIPPLRERTDDIAPLIAHFLQKHGRLAEDRTAVAAPSFVGALQRASLPGNVRQLENIIRRALINSGGERALEVADLPSDLWRELSAHAGGNHGTDQSGQLTAARNVIPNFVEEMLRRHNFDLGDCLEEWEDMLIHSVLCSCAGNQAKAARLLGITPRSMYNKLRRRVASSRTNGNAASG